MRVYVACSSNELDRAEAAIRALHDRDIEVTYDWTPDLRFARAEHPTDDTMHWIARVAGSKQCLHGLRRAHLVWFLTPTTATRGAYVELGVALERRASLRLAHLIASCSRAPTCFLEELADEDVYATDDLALARIVRIARGEVAA